MKKIIVPKLFGIIAILVLLFVSGGWIAPVKAAGSPAVGSKISSLLAIQIKEKLSEASSSGQSTVKPFADDSPSNTETTLANQEEVFLHFAQKPSSSQLNDLTALGVTVYPNTWIPPVGAFTTGFVLADMPINELSTLAAESYIVTMDTAEQSLSPQNDQAEAAMNVAPVWQSGDTGAGVTVAVLDSGIDTSNPDFPTLNSTNSMDYSNYPTLDDTITNTVTGHGTHVTGSLLGRGVNSPTYKGVAPGASLVFLKVGNDTDGSASSAAIVYALEAAVDTYHAKIINLSYGNWSEYHDGSDALCQAVDYATSQGAAVFVAAGNDGSNGWHASGTVGGAGSSYEVSIQVTGSSSLPISLVWYDDGAQNNLSLQYYGTDGTTLLASADGGQSESPRGTELNTYQLNTPVGTGTYNIKVTDNSTNYQNFQLYYLGGLTSVEFAGADPNYTICSPAEADSAIAVGCYVSRSSWTNYLGTNYSSNPAETVGSVADFSSRGPRIDMLQKPDIVAPGSAIISDRDPLYALGNPAYDPGIIDNDGLGLGPTNTGPADYYVLQGTSMASPMAAGVGALLLSQNPNMTPAQIKHTLEVTAYMPNLGSPSSPQWGWGLVNASAALSADISLNSYSTSSLNTSCTDFASYSTQHTVYLHSSNVLNSKSYNVTIYDGSNNDVANLGDFNDTYLNTNYTFTTTDKAGTWHAVVSEPQFSLPSTYNPSWVYTIMTAAFSVETSAISPGYPDVITKIVSNMTANSVTLNGQLVTPGSGGSASVSFDYGLTTNYGSAVVGVPASLDSAGTFSANISGLIPGVTYHYRAKANGGAAGSVNGADMTFNTDYLIVDTVGAFAGQSSLAISNAGSISMAYSTSNSGPGYSIKYGSWNGTTWQIQTVFSSVNATSPSLALDNQGNPCIAFVDSGTLKYATLIGSTWQIQTVDSTSVNTDAISLAIDSTNKPCITYTYASNNNVEYAHWSGTGWQIQTVAPNGDMPSLCLDSNNAPHIAYENLSKENLMYAQWNGSAWQVQTVDSTTWVGLSPSLKLNGSGYPCISYYDSSNYYLKYAAWNGSAWQIQIVDDDVMGLSQIGTRCSLQLNSAENPCISYYDSASETLKYTEWNGSTWRIITVDASGNVGQYSSLILDSSNNPTISYFDLTNQALRVAHFIDNPTSTVEHLQINTQPASTLSVDSSFSTAAVVTALDANNNPVIGAIITADRDPATGSGTLRGTLSAITSNSGQATFSNLGYNKTDVFKVRFTSNNKTIISTQLGPLSFGAAASLNINTAPLVGSSVDTSFSTQPVISAIDQFGNPVSGAVITASRVTGTGVLRGNLTATTATNTGLATFANLGYNKSGESFTIRFTDGALYINSGSLGPISSGAPNQIRVETAANGSGTVVPAQNVSTGSSITIYAITRDQYGNFVANAAGTWSLTSITGGVVTGDLVPSGDTKSAVFTGHLAGTAVIQVTSGFLTNMPSGTLTVTAAGATKLSVSGYASPATAGTPGSITVTAQDSSGNTITTYAGTVHFTSTGSQAALPANYTFVSGDHGTHSFNVTLKTSGSQSITATDTVTNTITGTQSAIIINPAAPSQIGVETAANGNGIVVPAQNVATGNSLTVYAVTRDQYGNFVANATGTWSLINKTNGITDSDIVPSIDSKSAVLTGHLVGTAVIHLAVNGLASIDSGTITMVVAVAVNAPATVEANNYQFNVPINISQVSNFYRCQFDVMFDSTVLQYVSTTWGQIGSTQMSGNGITSSSSIAAGDERFLVNLNALSSGISGSGTIATIRFQVIGNLGQGSTINLANDVLSDFSGNSIPAIWINGSVQVSVIPGDANGDGVVNILDMTKCAREILGLDPLTPGADANGDGVVNVLDLTKIARIILGLDP